MHAITGITGNVGGEVARALLNAGHAVRAVIRDPRKGAVWEALGCDVSLADMNDAAALAAARNKKGTKSDLRAFFFRFSLPSSPGLAPAIHVLDALRKSWMPGTSPGMTTKVVNLAYGFQ